MTAVHELLTRAASGRPGDLAVDDGDVRLSFAELEALCRRQASGLAAMGVGSGDRVAVLGRNSASYAALYFAASSLGAVLVTLNWRLAAEELTWILEDAGASVLVSEPRFEPVLGGREYALASVDAPWLGEDHGRDPAPADPAAAVLQMYTSGTSGRPKGAVLTHGNWDAMVGAWLRDMDMRPGDRFLQVTPLFHVGGALMLLSNMARAASLFLLPEFDPVLAIEALRGHRITHTLMVPAMIEWLLREPAAAAAPYDDLRLVVYGAAPMPVPTLRCAAEVLGCDFLQGYGLTETAGVLLTLTAEDHRPASFAPSASPAPDGRWRARRCVSWIRAVSRCPRGPWGRSSPAVATYRRVTWSPTVQAVPFKTLPEPMVGSPRGTSASPTTRVTSRSSTDGRT